MSFDGDGLEDLVVDGHGDQPILEPIPPREKGPLTGKRVLWLWVASIIGSVLVIPYALSLIKQIGAMEKKKSEVAAAKAEKGPDKAGERSSSTSASAEPNALAVVPPGFYPIIAVIQAVIEGGISLAAILLGLSFARRAGMGERMFVGEGADEGGGDPRRRSIVIGAVVGVAIGLALLGSGFLASKYFPQMEAGITLPPAWEGFLASIGAGIREEIWLRLGCMTFLAGLFAWLARKQPAGPVAVWSANVLAALAFGAIHLPQAAQLIGLSVPVVAFVLLGNGIPGVVWGWLYWRYGLIAAMVSHAMADIVTKAIWPLFGS